MRMNELEDQENYQFLITEFVQEKIISS